MRISCYYLLIFDYSTTGKYTSARRIPSYSVCGGKSRRLFLCVRLCARPAHREQKQNAILSQQNVNHASLERPQAVDQFELLQFLSRASALSSESRQKDFLEGCSIHVESAREIPKYARCRIEKRALGPCHQRPTVSCRTELPLSS